MHSPSSPATPSRRSVSPTALLGGKVGFAIIDDVGVMVMNIPQWHDEDIIRLMEESARLGNHITAAANISHFLGDIFGASQRKLIVDWLAKEGIEPSPRNATLTDSKIMRAALTAYSWLTKTETKAFLPTERRIVAEWICRDLQADPGDVQSALEACYRIIGVKAP